MEPFTLSTGPLLLDQPTEADIPTIVEYCQDPVFEHYMTLPWPYMRKDAELFVREYVPRGWESGNEVTWALRSSHGDFMGAIGLRAENAAIGYWLGAPHRGRGYMTLAMSAVADWKFSGGFAGVDLVRWEAVVGNSASLAVARRAGFTYTGIEPAMAVSRDGTRPASWQAVLRASDSRGRKPGWPALGRNENDTIENHTNENDGNATG